MTNSPNHLHIANVGMESEIYALSTENTHVFTHLGGLAVFDHLYFRVAPEVAGYIWQSNPAYKKLFEIAMEKGAQAHLNLRTVNQADVYQYFQNEYKDLYSSPSFPSNWLDKS